MLKKLLPLILLMTALCTAQLIDDDEMPFGPSSSRWASDTFYTDERLDSMHLSLGFNQIMAGGFTSSAVTKFTQHGIYPVSGAISWSSSGNDPQFAYAQTHYIIAHPEYDSSQHYETKFIDPLGETIRLPDANGDTCCYQYYRGSETMLSGLAFGVNNKIRWFDEQFKFYPILKLGIDSTWSDTNDVVGIFRIRRVTAPPEED